MNDDLKSKIMFDIKTFVQKIKTYFSITVLVVTVNENYVITSFYMHIKFLL